MFHEVRHRRSIKGIEFGFVIILMICLTPISPLFSNIAQGDGGMIPFHEFSVHEPGQKAIIGWNGVEEVMILSVDVQSGGNTSALHMVPFPSLPTVELGNVSAFEKVEELLNSYGGIGKGEGGDSGGSNESVEIMFHDMIGPHDVTVVRVNDSAEFVDWVNGFLAGKGITDVVMPQGLENTIDHYIQKHIHYFVFDVIELKPEEMSIDPLVYRFRTDALHFPLQISSIIEGHSDITLALLTEPDMPIDMAPLQDMGFGRWSSIKVNQENLTDIDPTLAELFEGDCALGLFEGRFDLEKLEGDVELSCGIEGVRWKHATWGDYNRFTTLDVDDDGIKDIISADYNDIYAIDGIDGTLLWSLLENEDVDWWASSTPVVGDVDSDGKNEIVICNGHAIMLIDAQNGTSIWKFENEFSRYLISIVFEDVNQDRTLDVIFNTDDTLYALDGNDGTPFWNHSLEYDATKLMVYDFDEDGKFEIVVSQKNSLKVINGEDGTLAWEYQIDDGTRVTEDPWILDIDLDGVQEIVLGNRDTIYTFTGTSGNLEWSYTWDDDYIQSCSVGNVDLDIYPEILVRTYENIFAINGKDGIHQWSYNIEEGIRSSPLIADLDSDGTDEVVICSYEGVYAIDGSEGTLIWHTDIEYTWNPTAPTIADLDGDGGKELLVLTRDALVVLRGDGLEPFWNFSVGEIIHTFTVDDLDSDGCSEVVVLAYGAIYLVEHPDLQITFQAFPERVTPGGNSTQVVFIGYGNYPFEGASVEFSDSGSGGIFTDPSENGNGFYTSIYSVLESAKIDSIITITATVNSDLFDERRVETELYIIENESSPISEMEHELNEMNLSMWASPPAISLGEITTVLVYVSNHSSPILDVSFILSDDDRGGTFSKVSSIGEGYYTFTYTPAGSASQDITIFALATARDHQQAIGMLSLAVTTLETHEPQDPPNGTGIGEMTVHAYPQEMEQGGTAALLIHITNTSIPISKDSIQLFDHGAGGEFSSIMDFGDGYYSVDYTTASDYVGLVRIGIIAFLNGGELLEFIELTVSEAIGEPSSAIENEGLQIVVEAYPDSLGPEESCMLVISVWWSGTILKNVLLQVHDSEAGGSFSSISERGDGYYFLKYKAPSHSVGDITITVTASHQEHGSVDTAFVLEVTPENQLEEKDGDDRSESVIYGGLIIIIFGALLVLSIGLYRKMTNKKE